jgi:hypothetical protein
LFHKAFSFVVSSFDPHGPVRAVSQASLSVCSGVAFGAAVETGSFLGLSTACCEHPWRLHPRAFLCAVSAGVRGRVVPDGSSKQKAGAGSASLQEEPYHFLLNLSNSFREFFVPAVLAL